MGGQSVTQSKTKQKRISDETIDNLVRKIAPNSRGWYWEQNDIVVKFREPKKVKNSVWNKLTKKLGELGVSDVMLVGSD